MRGNFAILDKVVMLVLVDDKSIALGA